MKNILKYIIVLMTALICVSCVNEQIDNETMVVVGEEEKGVSEDFERML